MKYSELVQFEPITEVVKFSRLNEEDYRKKQVKDFIFSEKYETKFIPAICNNLDYTTSSETFGLQIVGSYGTGKSHLMTLVSLIAENADYLSMVTNENAKAYLSKIAGKYKIIRFELGNREELWDIVCHHIDKGLAEMGVDYSISADKSHENYSTKLEKMMGHFEAKYPDKGLLVVIDEMLGYLRGRTASGALDLDLAVLQALGQSSDHSRFRMMFGVQELIYNDPNLHFAAKMLQKVNDRYKDLTITKQDVQYVVQHRLLKKNESQKAIIKKHLGKFTGIFTDLHAHLDDYVELYPVNPSYFDNFQNIRIDKSQREILKTLSKRFGEIQNDDVPTTEPGLIGYDSYWFDLKRSENQNNEDINKVTEIMDIIYQKIDDNFTGPKQNKKGLAQRIANACAIKALQADLSHPNGVSAEKMVDDLCYLDATCFDRNMLLDVIDTTAKMIVSSTQGQYFEQNESNEEFHLRVEGGVNYGQKIKEFARTMPDEVKDLHFFNYLVEYLPIEVEQYRREFKIFCHKINWKSHKVMLDGYIFMGHPDERSTTQPQQHFYIYFMPVFTAKKQAHGNEPDSIYVHMEKMSNEMKELLCLYASAEALEAEVDTSQKRFYRDFARDYASQLKKVFDRDFIEKTEFYYQGKLQEIAPKDMMGDSKEQVVSNIASMLLEEYFCNELPNYPKFPLLYQPITTDNFNVIFKACKQKIANPLQSNRDAEAVLSGLGLWEDGHLSTEHSIYAQSIKQALEDKGEGKVLNRDEIISRFWENTYKSNDYGIDAEYEFLVLAVMTAMGEIEIEIQGKNINAANIKEIVDMNRDASFSFSHIKRPIGMDVPLVREIFLRILGRDCTSQLGKPEIYSELLLKAKSIAESAVTLADKVHNGIDLENVVVISTTEGLDWNTHLTVLKNFCDRLQNYGSAAKMRRLPWKLDELKKDVLPVISDIEPLKRKLQLVEDLRGRLSYLLQAQQYVMDDGLKNEMDKMQGKAADVLKSPIDETVVANYKTEIDALIQRYAQWYLSEYSRMHISELDALQKDRIAKSDKNAICSIACSSAFLGIGNCYDLWKEKMSQLTIGDPSVNLKAVLRAPFIGFNPMQCQGKALPDMNELSKELDDIFEVLDNNVRSILNDTKTMGGMDALDESEKRLVENLKQGGQLNRQNIQRVSEIIDKLHKGVKRIQIEEKDLKDLFNRPKTPAELIKAFNDLIRHATGGSNEDNIRIILK